ncbi:hypothetical protein GUITHDRAFT_166930 [Guillardia theta CCMP2712]|uniref:MsrB domain-containing protein n=1 Tax=Guillardia theta (strain CCMP2712) TaxID=905079 RepID=L1I521_GUITC|nr:hypothetical protein GUITHDRAFT_166930 [Guillardia theta CCMP2712]EKX31192.1 hypothetical protein GUITHDRAFT_166930 [Guillardia theta CCMP2712]|eukprot:XP_005818172.1 hypothetical protein GUITHDRAFT_166930 [Guillardia theta CCMP2712]
MAPLGKATSALMVRERDWHFLSMVALGASDRNSALRGFCDAPVMQDLRFGTKADWELANKICCHNKKYAEPSGYFNNANINLFGQFQPEEKYHTFYDSVCGVPLFRAPIGRSMQEWYSESLAHGWPSFRDAEVVRENVVVEQDGEVRSVCGTHLGHNLPDNKGSRYCIDLVCIAGKPALGPIQEPHFSMRGKAQELVETRVKADVSLLPSGNYFFMGNIVVLLIAVIAIILGLLIINRTRRRSRM